MEPIQQGELLVEIRPQEDLLSRFQSKPGRILVPITLESASAAALRYASDLALRFGSELVLFYAFEDPDCRNASRVESQLWKWTAAIRSRHPAARIFLRAGTVCEQLKAVARAVRAGLAVMSRDYYARFLSWSAREEAGVLAIQGMPCPVALVDVPAGSLNVEATAAAALSNPPATSATAPESPKPVTRHAVRPLVARARLRGSRNRLNRGRFRSHHCFAHVG